MEKFGCVLTKKVRLYFVAERILKSSIETVFLTSSYALFQGNFSAA